MARTSSSLQRRDVDRVLLVATPAAVQAAARKYYRNIHWAYLGDVNKVDRRLLQGL